MEVLILAERMGLSPKSSMISKSTLVQLGQLPFVVSHSSGRLEHAKQLGMADVQRVVAAAYGHMPQGLSPDGF
ncbi:hypothetical protein [Desulfonatronum thiodismutans]|uniref:hypothetical protein n=1 Tax=Desulfonatronum thiodismutans TaxID=159290 RepID=UPI0004ABE938|nr:hypothetical protein [Desulfonatronum thiodismutans]